MTWQKVRSATRLGRGLAMGAMLASMVGLAAPATAQIFDPAFNAAANAAVNAIAVQADGKVLIGGAFTQVNGVARSHLARLNADGSLDTAFTTSVSGPVNALAVLPDGDILVAGLFLQVGTTTKGSIARLMPDGSLDPTFTAAVTSSLSCCTATVFALVVESNGSILVGGAYDTVNGVTRNNLARLNADGTLDGTFAPSILGLVAGDVFALAVQPNGAIVLGGEFTSVNGIAKRQVARLNAGGTLDNTFSSPMVGNAEQYVDAVAVRTDGRILVGGVFTLTGASGAIPFAQLNADGSPDTSFNVPISGVGFHPPIYVATIVLQADGRILIGGHIGLVDGINSFAATRLLPDGTFDSSFGTTAGASDSNTILAIVLQPNGKVLIGGTFGLSNVARLLPATPAVITQVAPASGQPGQANLNVVVTGQSTNFVQGTTTASFGAGITVNSTTVQSATQATANVTIAAGAALGARTVTLTTGGEVAALVNGFTVTAATPVITQVAPASGQQGASLNVVVTGQSTHFVQGTTTGSFGAGLTVNSTTVQSATQATANVTIAAGAALGARAVTLTTGGEIVSLASGFTVTTGTPALSLVSPSGARRSQANLIVSLTGQLTHFVQGQTTANFGPGIAVNSTTVQSATQATASVTIAGNAALGPRTVTLTTGGEIVALPGGFAVTALTLTTGDFDGDGRADVTVYRPSNGGWYDLKSGTNYSTFGAYQWGLTGDIPVRGDFDGDGKADVAVYRPSNGGWYILQSSTNYSTYVSYLWGLGSDMPVPGDYDGDGKTDIAVYRPSNGGWYILQSSTNYSTYVSYLWGLAGDIPVPSDYDGDGKTEIAVYRPSNGGWYALQSSTNYTTFVSYLWGLAGDVPIPADYDGDGKADIAVYRPSNGGWYVLQSSTNYTAFVSYLWGLTGDVPVPADYDGDGKADIAVYRPSNGGWYILQSSTNYTAFVGYLWGLGGDVPLLKRS